jgi:hypothetical protein
MPITHEELATMRCPSCGGPLEQGFIAGHWTRLRWTLKASTKTIFAGTPLKKKRDWWNAPTLDSTRCDQCKLGLFRYDN